MMTSNNSFSLEDKSPFLGPDMLPITVLKLSYNCTNKMRNSLLKQRFSWSHQSTDARAGRVNQIELSFGMYHCVQSAGVSEVTEKKILQPF